MISNLHQNDRIIRAILGLALILIGLLVSMSSTLQIVLIVLGVIFLGTSVINFCPLYRIFNFSTKK